MKEFEGTKGEWLVVDAGTYISIESEKSFIAEIDEVDGYESNAQLMISAPDLLKALQNLLELKEIKDTKGKTDYYQENQPKAWEEAKQAINKALNSK